MDPANQSNMDPANLSNMDPANLSNMDLASLPNTEPALKPSLHRIHLLWPPNTRPPRNLREAEQRKLRPRRNR